MHWIDFREPVTAQKALDLRALNFRLTVYCDGDDVTKDCVLADALNDYVLLLARDVNGRPYLDPDDPDTPAKFSRLGKVTFALDVL